MNSQMHPNIVQGMNNFNSPKPEGDIDLIAKVREILVGLVPEEQVVAFYDNHRLILDGKGKISDVQKYLLNRYWYTQFCACPDNMSARLGLIPDGCGDSWLKIFKMSCVAFINKNNLPKQIEQTG